MRRINWCVTPLARAAPMTFKQRGLRMMDAEEQVVLVDAVGGATGLADKLEAHRAGLLHLAVSVFVFDRQGRVLLQKRQASKYHSQGQWANACCSHPRDGETPLACAQRRLVEEMGFACVLSPVFSTLYRADVGNGLCEHEYVHVFAGHYDGPITPAPAEADGYQWMALTELRDAARASPQAFAPWLRIYLSGHLPALEAASAP